MKEYQVIYYLVNMANGIAQVYNTRYTIEGFTRRETAEQALANCAKNVNFRGGRIETAEVEETE